jgi:DNA mismatch endonuclease (patch repair protein)
MSTATVAGPVPKDAATTERMKRQRTKGTGPELALRSELWRRGLRYNVERSVVNRRRRVDIVFVTARLAVFVDGCFWHGCPLHGTTPRTNTDWWSEKLTRNRMRDLDTDRELGEHGWTVLRFWEHEDPVDAADRIGRMLAHHERQERT